MMFANPSYLWALLGLIIPIAIHLWSNKAGKTIKVGSIQFLKESDSSRSSSIKLNEYLLLATRVLLLSVLVLILAEPQLKQTSKNKSLTYIVEPSLLLNESIKLMVDTLETDDIIRLLHPNFPEIGTTNGLLQTNKVPDYWQLAQDLEALESDSIVVFTSASFSGIKGKRPTISKNIEWIILNSEEPKTTNLAGFKKDDTIEIISATSSSQSLGFKTEKISQNSERIGYTENQDSLTLDSNEKAIALYSKPNLEVLIYYENEFDKELQYIQSTLNAISKYSSNQISVTKLQSISNVDFDTYSLVIWLGKQLHPDVTTNILIYQFDELSTNLIEQGTLNNMYYLTKPLTSNIILNERLPERLLQLLNPRPIDKNQIKTVDRRVISKAELLPNFMNRPKDIGNSTRLGLYKWLWFVFIPILISERLLAKRRKQ